MTGVVRAVEREAGRRAALDQQTTTGRLQRRLQVESDRGGTPWDNIRGPLCLHDKLLLCVFSMHCPLFCDFIDKGFIPSPRGGDDSVPFLGRWAVKEIALVPNTRL